MRRIQLQLTDAQDRRLRALARQRRSNRAELIREAAELLLGDSTSERDPLLELVGSAGPAGRSDVCERHVELLEP